VYKGLHNTKTKTKTRTPKNTQEYSYGPGLKVACLCQQSIDMGYKTMRLTLRVYHDPRKRVYTYMRA
jgi:hypothetical protein